MRTGWSKPGIQSCWSASRYGSPWCWRSGSAQRKRIERSRKWGEELNRQWLEKGIEKGIQKGERELVLRMVALRFGPEAADDLAPVLAGIADSDRVAAIAAKVFECETARELAEWARGD